MPGGAPYVRNAGDLARFLDSLEGFFDFFAGEAKGRFSTPLEIKRLLDARDPDPFGLRNPALGSDSIKARTTQCPLSGVKRTFQCHAATSAFDPKRTL